MPKGMGYGYGSKYSGGTAGELKAQPATPDQGVINQPMDSNGYPIPGERMTPHMKNIGNQNVTSGTKGNPKY